MRRHRKSLWTNACAGILLSAAIGLAVIFVCVLLFAAATYFLLENMDYNGFFSSASEAVGAFAGSFICGKYRRRNGLREGICCALLIFGILSVFGLIFTGGIPGIKNLLLLSVSGAAGGVYGVNSKRPKGLRN